MTVNGYNATYDSAETSEVAVDIIITGGIAVIGFVNLFVLLWIYGKLKKRF